MITSRCSNDVLMISSYFVMSTLWFFIVVPLQCPYFLLMIFSWFLYDFVWFSNDLLMILSWFSKDSLMISLWAAYDVLMIFQWFRMFPHDYTNKKIIRKSQENHEGNTIKSSIIHSKNLNSIISMLLDNKKQFFY